MEQASESPLPSTADPVYQNQDIHHIWGGQQQAWEDVSTFPDAQ